MVGLDLGNKLITLRVGRQEWHLHHALFLQKKDVYLGRKQSHQCVMDLLYLLGTNFAPKVAKLRKYYYYNFKEGHNRNTMLKM